MTEQDKLVKRVTDAITRDRAARAARDAATTEARAAAHDLSEAWTNLRRYQDEIVAAVVGYDA